MNCLWTVLKTTSRYVDFERWRGETLTLFNRHHQHATTLLVERKAIFSHFLSSSPPENHLEIKYDPCFRITSTPSRRMKIRCCCKGWNQELTSLRLVCCSLLQHVHAGCTHTSMLNGEIWSCRVSLLICFSFTVSCRNCQYCHLQGDGVPPVSERREDPQKWQHQATLIAPEQKYVVWKSY